MSIRIFVDVGSTFTDCAVIYPNGMVSAKSPTVLGNTEESVLSALRECAGKLRMDLSQLLQVTVEFGFATTLALNQLLERKGPRLGLLVTAGVEDTIYIGLGAQWIDGIKDREWGELLPKAKKPIPLIPRELCVGVRERIDSRGKIIRPLDEQHLRQQLRGLVNKGVQGMVVSLLWSFLNPVHEHRIREIIYSEFCQGLYHYPVILSSEVASARGEYQRSMTAIVNAYLQKTMQEEVAGTVAALRKHGYQGELTVVQNNGGWSDVWRTAPLFTYHGGPVAGLMGCKQLSQVYGEKIVATDMGGTSFDVGFVCENEPIPHESRPTIDRWLISGNILEVSSIGSGSGSIFRVNGPRGNELEMGPDSAGAIPGPVAYDLGGKDPTVMDADVVLGYLDPETFACGKRKLNRERAERAIAELIARPLGISVVEAAARMRKMANEWMGHTLMKEMLLRGYHPGEFTVFAYGGAGPTHCCDYTRALEPKRIVTFPFSHVFCAVASAFLPQSRTYYSSKPFVLMYPGDGQWTNDYETFNQVVSELQAQALADMETSGGCVPTIRLELDMKFGGQVHSIRVVSPRLKIDSPSDAERIYHAFTETYSRRFSRFSLYPEGGVIIETFILHASMQSEPFDLPVFPEGSSSPSRALKGRRDVFWIYEGHWMSTPVYLFELLHAGNVIEGPAVIESDYTTYVIPWGYRFTLDRHMAGIIEKIR